MRSSESVPDLSPGVVADPISRLEEIGHLLWWERPTAGDDEHRLVLDLARYRAFEAAAMLGTLAERLAGRPIAA